MDDPTYQTSGDLQVFFRNSIYARSTYMSSGKLQGPRVIPNPPSYAPQNAPPPAWNAPKDYSTYPGMVPACGTLPPGDSSVYGAGFFYYCRDLSSAHVVPQKQYIFTTDLRGDFIRFYWVISGAGQGSTILPGFGLYSLRNNPNTWTYVVPPVFTGSYGIEVVNRDYPSVIVLRVDHKPVRSDSPATLVFRVEAVGWSNTYGPGSAPEPGADEAVGEGGSGSTFEIVSHKSQLKVVDEPLVYQAPEEG